MEPLLFSDFQFKMHDGTFIGHVIPGTVFIVFSIWHAVKTIEQYFKCKASNGMIKFRAHSYYACAYCPRLPFESILKVVGILVGIAEETFFFQYHGNLQHNTMYSFFGLVGIVEICHFYKFQLPPNMCYMCYVLAFAIEDILFYWHTTGRPPMDTQIHMLLLYTGVGVCILIILEMFHRDCVQVCLCRIYMVLLHGLWFYGIACILYGDYVGLQVWEESPGNMMLAAVFFSAHAAGALLIMALIWFGFAFKYSPGAHKNVDYSSLGEDDTDFELRSPEESFN